MRTDYSVEIALSSQSQFNHAVETISLGFFPLVIVISFGTQRVSFILSLGKILTNQKNCRRCSAHGNNGGNNWYHVLGWERMPSRHGFLKPIASPKPMSEEAV
jgi:hypothetical protein